ncbi:MAG: hypothetical protein DRJ59_03145 [Thermoprotei archaeon]|nr:MAG: hypothetical protein DRJ59_03145 [Thermoprotei archaeon]
MIIAMKVVVRRRLSLVELLGEEGGGVPYIRQAYEEYEEDGESYFLVEEELDPQVLRRLLAPHLVRLLEEISRGVKSITELANRVNRSVPNVYKNLVVLEKYKLISLRREGRYVKPIKLVEEILILP